MAGILKLLLKRKSKSIDRNARQRVLSTYELLESILLYLEPPDLRNARLVSNYWNAVILRSQDMRELWRTPLKKTLRLGRILLLGDIINNICPGSGFSSIFSNHTILPSKIITASRL